MYELFDFIIWKVIFKALQSRALKITYFYWQEEAPLKGALTLRFV